MEPLGLLDLAGPQQIQDAGASPIASDTPEIGGVLDVEVRGAGEVASVTSASVRFASAYSFWASWR